MTIKHKLGYLKSTDYYWLSDVALGDFRFHKDEEKDKTLCLIWKNTSRVCDMKQVTKYMCDNWGILEIFQKQFMVTFLGNAVDEIDGENFILVKILDQISCEYT